VSITEDWLMTSGYEAFAGSLPVRIPLKDAMIFIAHSRADQAIAADLEARLRARGATTWLDFSRIPVGERFVEEIAGALRQSSLFVLVSSADSTGSYWVSREVGFAKRLRASGVVDQLIRLDIDGAELPAAHFDRTFSRMQDAVGYLSSESQPGAQARSGLDLHRVDVEYYQPRPAPRVWLGFSAELAAIDRWFFEAKRGLWVSGLGGAGKSSLASVWMTALRMIGYAKPLSVSIRQWDYYEAPEGVAALEAIRPWIDPLGRVTQLLVLDGMDEFRHAPVREVHELGLRYPELRILVTSRQSVPGEYSSAFDTLELQALDPAQSECLAARLGVDQEVFERLFSLLQGHPLAISLAANLVERGADVDGILRTLESQQ
jgi:hypothetical protein